MCFVYIYVSCFRQYTFVSSKRKICFFQINFPSYNIISYNVISDCMSEKYLNMQFHQFGPINQVVVDRERGHALVFFEQISCAQAAVKEMRGTALRGRRLQVDFASRECQETFYEHLERQGIAGERPWDTRPSPATTFDVSYVYPPYRSTFSHFSKLIDNWIENKMPIFLFFFLLSYFLFIPYSISLSLNFSLYINMFSKNFWIIIIIIIIIREAFYEQNFSKDEMHFTD